MTAKIAALTIKKWGNSLAVRIPAAIARKARFHSGMPVLLMVQEGNMIVSPAGDPKLTLAERLEIFDPEKHAGEVMVSGRIGLDRF